jgi:hypothetical protein
MKGSVTGFETMVEANAKGASSRSAQQIPRTKNEWMPYSGTNAIAKPTATLSAIPRGPSSLPRSRFQNLVSIRRTRLPRPESRGVFAFVTNST